MLTIMEIVLTVLWSVICLLIVGIVLSPLYFAYRKRHELWQKICSTVPDKYLLLLRAKLIRWRIIKKIRHLGIESQSQGLIAKINQIINQDLIRLLENKTILVASTREAESACKFHDENKSIWQQELITKQKSFQSALEKVNSQINHILHFLDSLSLSLSELQIKGLVANEQIEEIISKADDDIYQIFLSLEEISDLTKQEGNSVKGVISTRREKVQQPPKVAAG